MCDPTNPSNTPPDCSAKLETVYDEDAVFKHVNPTVEESQGNLVKLNNAAEDFGITREDIGHAFAQNMSMQQLSQLLCIASLHKTMEQLDKDEFDRQETLVIIDVAAQGNMERMTEYRERFDHPTDDVLVRSLLIKELFK